jgi:predicted metal-binding membrane protein
VVGLGVSETASGSPLTTPREGLGEAFAAVRSRLGLVLLLLLLAGVAWWATANQMAGMAAAPGEELGALGWFVGVWIVMMAAMMFPSVAPTVALYARMTRQRSWARPLLFTASYLIVWGAVGLASYGLFELGKHVLGAQLSWSAGGRWAVAATLLAAAVYEVTPLKNACLTRCRTPLGFLLGSWRDGSRGALEMGARHAAWCVGCCWALMAAQFALGVMSLVWMAVIAALITIEKTLPWRRSVLTFATVVLLVLAVMVVVAPHSIPGLVIPGTSSAMQMTS